MLTRNTTAFLYGVVSSSLFVLHVCSLTVVFFSSFLLSSTVHRTPKLVVHITGLVLMISNTFFTTLALSCSSVVMRQYVIEEVMNEGLQTALATYNLVGAKGDGSEADIKNDIEDMLKVGDRKD